MTWDMGLEGLLVLGAWSLGFGVLAGVFVGGAWANRLWTVVIATVACFGVGLLVSEWLFGWATEEELQPNIDGLSRDEAVLSGLITSALVVVVMRYRSHHSSSHPRRHLAGRHRGDPVGHA